jgi:uncharacterized protein (TIGR02217 family)
MSNTLFPTLTMPTGSYTWPIAKYHEFSTIVLPTASLRGELAKSLSLYALWHFDLDFALLAGDLNVVTSAVASVIGFHMQMRGSYSTWLFNDPYDNATIGNVQFGIGDGATLAFQLIRPIAGGTDIIQNLNGAPTILVNDVVQSAGGYTVSPTGVITFSSAPAAGSTLKWNGLFYFRCRFDNDKLSDLRQIAPSTWDVHSVAFHTVIL